MDENFAEFMKKKKINDREIEDELNMMMEGDPDFKKLRKKKDQNDIDSIDCKNK